jgi:preprotein translocase subunit SecE
VAEKSVKTNLPAKSKPAAAAAKTQTPVKAQAQAKPRRFFNLPAPAKDKDKNATRQPNRIQKWFRETIGELRKVSWPTPQEAWKLTKVVLAVMAATAIFLGVLDEAFSRIIALLVA